MSIRPALDAFFAVPRRGTDVHALTGLRGVAVLLVFCTHFVSLAESALSATSVTKEVAHALAIAGDTGVDLFFVLSGYLIYGGLLTRRTSFLSHLRRRARRIYPVFVAVLGIYVVLAMLLPNLGKLPVDRANAFAYVVANLLLLPGVFPITPIITVAWSLSFEALFYLTVPLVVYGFDLECRTSSQRATGLVGLALAIGLGIGGASPAHARLVMFVVGMLVFELALRGLSWRLPSGIVSGVLTLFGVVVGARGEMGLLWHYGVLSLGFLLMCLEALRAGSPTALALAWSPIRWLGAMSYSYFLIHGLAANALVAALRLLAPEFIGHELGFWLALTVTFVWTLMPAAALFALVEKPWSFSVPAVWASATATSNR